MTKLKSKRIVIIGTLFLAALLAVVIYVLISPQTTERQGGNTEVITASTLEKIVDVSELSTFVAVYNGIAEVMNQKEPGQLDYYVSYAAQVYAGIDVEEIGISVDDATKEVMVDIPDVHITEINVDISSLDFIFYSDCANASTVTQAAFRACEADVQAESEKQDAILKLAQQNAANLIRALVCPLLEQQGDGYTLTVE